MSKAALFAGLSKGLGAYGQSLHENQLLEKEAKLASAEARRKASLEKLKRQWDVQDQEDNQAHEREMVGVEAQADIAKTQWERENPEPVSPADEALIRKRDAQTESAQARAEKIRKEIESGSGGKDIFGVVQPRDYTPQSVQKFNENYSETGKRDFSILEQKESSSDDARLRRDTMKDVASLSESMFTGGGNYRPSVEMYVEDNPQDAQRLGITAQTPLSEAIPKVEKDLMENFLPSRQSSQNLGVNTTTGNQTQRNQQSQNNSALLGDVINGAQQQMQPQPQQPQQPVVPPMGTMPGAGQQQQQPRPGQQPQRPQPGPQPGQQGDLVALAIQAITQGNKDPNAVIQRMKERGASPQEIQQVQQAIQNGR